MSTNNAYPGQRLGLPREGAGALAQFWPRVGALAVDWGLAVAVSLLLFHYNPWATAGAFVVLTWLSSWLLGGTIGHLVFGMRLNTVDQHPPGPWRPALRQVLLMLVIPVLVTDEDGRGAHDVLSGLVLRRFVRG